jgi:hypothetical protein
VVRLAVASEESLNEASKRQPSVPLLTSEGLRSTTRECGIDTPGR